MSDNLCKNTDIEIWRETEGDYYADYISVTKGGGITICVVGSCVTNTVQDWHRLADTAKPIPDELAVIDLIDEVAFIDAEDRDAIATVLRPYLTTPEKG